MVSTVTFATAVVTAVALLRAAEAFYVTDDPTRSFMRLPHSADARDENLSAGTRDPNSVQMRDANSVQMSDANPVQMRDANPIETDDALSIEIGDGPYDLTTWESPSVEMENTQSAAMETGETNSVEMEGTPLIERVEYTDSNSKTLRARWTRRGSLIRDGPWAISLDDFPLDRYAM